NQVEDLGLGIVHTVLLAVTERRHTAPQAMDRPCLVEPCPHACTMVSRWQASASERVSPRAPAVCPYTCACGRWISQIAGVSGRVMIAVSPSVVVAYRVCTVHTPQVAGSGDRCPTIVLSSSPVCTTGARAGLGPAHLQGSWAGWRTPIPRGEAALGPVVV